MQNDTYINKKANNIYFLFRFTFEENFAQISPKFQFRVLRNFRETQEKFRENTQTKTFAATLIIFDQLDKEQVF